MLLQQQLDTISAAIQESSAVSESLKISLGYRYENGYIEPTGSFDMPANMPESAIRAVFNEMLERQQQKELEAFRNLWVNQGVEFDFHSRDNIATLTLIKETSLEEETKTPKAAKAPKATKAKKAKKSKAPKKAAPKKAASATKSTRGRKGFSDEQKSEVLEFIKNNPGRGVLKVAASKFKVSYPTVNLWVKAAGISPKAPKGAAGAKASKAAKSAGKAKVAGGKKVVSGAILLNGLKYVPASSIKAEKPVKAAKAPKANKGLARALKALDKALSLLKKSV